MYGNEIAENMQLVVHVFTTDSLHKTLDGMQRSVVYMNGYCEELYNFVAPWAMSHFSPEPIIYKS